MALKIWQSINIRQKAVQNSVKNCHRRRKDYVSLSEIQLIRVYPAVYTQSLPGGLQPKALL